jgi:hypothetical protein
MGDPAARGHRHTLASQVMEAMFGTLPTSDG